MKITRYISILLVLCSALCMVSGGFCEPETAEGESFEYFMNMLRVYKNAFYNNAEAALAEDPAYSSNLYRLFDFVYGDAMLDLFGNSMLGGKSFALVLEQKGYTGCAAMTDGSTHSAAAAEDAEGNGIIFVGDYYAAQGGALLRRVQAGRQASYFWRREEGRTVIQYMYPDPEGGSLYKGYRAYINDDGTGTVLCGLRCTEAAVNAFISPGAGDGIIADMIFGYDTLTLTAETISVLTDAGEKLTHTIGDIPEQETDEPDDDEEADDGEEP